MAQEWSVTLSTWPPFWLALCGVCFTSLPMSQETYCRRGLPVLPRALRRLLWVAATVSGDVLRPSGGRRLFQEQTAGRLPQAHGKLRSFRISSGCGPYCLKASYMAANQSSRNVAGENKVWGIGVYSV